MKIARNKALGIEVALLLTLSWSAMSVGGAFGEMTSNPGRQFVVAGED